MIGRRTRSERRAPRFSAALRERESVMPLELFFDLVFVLGFTQCTALMVNDPSWAGVGQAMLVLAMLWWAWGAYAWLTSLVDPEEGGVRIAIFAAMAGLLIVALSVPEAFGDRALAFALAYGAVRGAHIALFAIGGRDDPELRRSVSGIAVSTAVAIGLLIAASAFDGTAQTALWLAALAIDWGLPAVFGAAGWRLVAGHFAERHNLIIILALGESIVALGVGATADLSAGLIVAAVLGIGLASALWWTYFDVVALVTERRLHQAEPGLEQNRLAIGSYSYLHFPMVAGIILAALGLEQTLAHHDEHLHTVPAFALLGGVAIYLLAHVALRLRNARTLNRQRFLLAVVLLALWPLADEVSALVALAAVNVLLWVLVAYETTTYDERRYRLRHRLEVELPEPAASSGPDPAAR